MDIQLFVACLAVAAFAGFVGGYIVGNRDRQSMSEPTEHGGNPR
jgi:hypothetical protein